MCLNVGDFYFVSSQYGIDFPNAHMMKNKKNGNNRPYFIAHVENTGIMWSIPISSQITKYRHIYNKIVNKHKKCYTIVFGKVIGRDSVFLIQNGSVIERGRWGGRARAASQTMLII